MSNTKPNQKQSASLSYYSDSSRNRSNHNNTTKQQRAQPYININNTNSRRKQLTELDFKNVELVETNRQKRNA